MGILGVDEKADGIKVLGGGCAKCHELEANTKAALEELGIAESIELITDFAVIATYGVMSTPALVIDHKVVAYGKVLKKDEIIKLLSLHYETEKNTMHTNGNEVLP